MLRGPGSILVRAGRVEYSTSAQEKENKSAEKERKTKIFLTQNEPKQHDTKTHDNIEKGNKQISK